MMRSPIVSPELLAMLRRLRLGHLADTLPERLVLADKQSMPHQDFLLMILSEEVNRRDSCAIQNRIHEARLDPSMTLDRFDTSAKIVYDKRLYAELSTLRFIQMRKHVIVLGPVGVGKTFLGSSLGHIACEQGYHVRFIRTDEMLRKLRGSRLDNSRDALMVELTTVDLLIIDDFALEPMSRDESKDVYQLFVERTDRASTIVTSNRDTSEWLAMFDDVLQAQSAVDRFKNAAYDLVIEGESYRPRLKPKPDPSAELPTIAVPAPKARGRRSRKR
jgi:DNA replication protein DnaC